MTANTDRPPPSLPEPPQLPPTRLVPNARGDVDVVRLGRRRRSWRDLYHRLLTMSWPRFLGLTVGVYLTFNTLFALLYLADPGGIASAREGSFADAFFFSVQTLATIGYGTLYPRSLYANLLMTAESLSGIIGFAIATGVIFARVSRPTARVMFSRAAVVAIFDGMPTLMFRAANERDNQILEAHVRVALVRDESTAEGQVMRRFHDLKLAREYSPVFALTMTIMHPLDEESPLCGTTPEMLRASNAEIVVTLTGIDDTFAQTVYARHSYVAGEIHWNRRLADIIGATSDGRRAIDFGRFHETEAADLPPPQRRP
jgi:inward rectifier potassium channel